MRLFARKTSQDVREMRAVMQAIRRNRRFVITSHVNPDWDGMGSGMALAALLKRLGKKAVLANEGGMPDIFQVLPRLAPVLDGLGGDVTADVAIVVDSPTFGRVGAMKPFLQKIPLLICIDHHVSNQRFADVNWVDPEAASVGEMIYRLYRAFRIKPTREEALGMYVSLVTDTGSFRYMNTTPAVHRIAADLIASGVSPLRISQQLFESYSAADLKFLGKVLSTMRFTPDGRVAWLEVPYKLLKVSKAGPEIVDELVNFPRSIRQAEVAFVLREIGNKPQARVSFRSKGNVNVDKIARHFGGGGHIAASGCTVEGTLSQARQRILRVVRQALAKKHVGNSA